MGSDEEEVLYQSSRTLITRVMTPQGPVIRKHGRGTDAAARIRSETGLLQRLSAVPGVPRLAWWDTRISGATLSLVDLGHMPVGDFVATARPGPQWLVGFARDVARVLAGVHGAGVLHADLSPGNVLVRPDGTDPMLADYDLATTFAEDHPEFTHPTEIAGTLPYLSPERTGRTGHPADHRADLYSLGAVLYELATGRPPFGFGADDPLTLLHAHLALTPVAPADLDPRVPTMLSAIIMRLLEKEPDRRYAGAEGLAHDLSRLAAGEPDVVFSLGGKDFPPRLVAPSRLVGRDEEIAELRAAFDAARDGGTRRALLVAGPPGVGKSALLDQLRPLVTTSGAGLLVSGKFDQYRHDSVADGLVQALRGLGRLLLAEPEEASQAQRERLLTALAGNAGHAAATLPELASLLQVAPQLGEGDSGELAQRTNRAFVQLLSAVAGPGRPVVIVLDDLQWASGFALGALDALVTDDGLDGVLVVGGYRDAEVGPDHPLAGMTSRWQRLNAMGAVLTLQNLPDADMGAFLAEMLRIPRTGAAELAAAIGVHTKGNPFDTLELVNALRREGDLVLTDDGWRWDADEIRRYVGGGQVLHLIQERVDRLPEPTQELLRTMACLGGAVELPLLRAVAGGEADDVTAEGIVEDWVPALEEGLLVLDRTAAGSLRFRHDRVQQAVHTLLAEGDERSRHLALARHLASLGPQFEGVAAEQYQAAVGELTDPDERRTVAGLFERAAEHAGRVANNEIAERYLASALALLDAAGSSPDAEGDEVEGDEVAALRLRLNVARHAALCGLRQFEAADEVFARVEARAEDPVLRARVAVVQLGALTFRGRLAEALRLGTAAMAAVGHPVPAEADLDAQIGAGLERLRAWVAGRDEAAESDRPECRDPRVQVVGQLVNRLVPTAFFSGDRLMVWLVTEAARLWEVHGATPSLVGPLAHAAFATIAAAADYRTGHAVTRWVLEQSAARGYEPAHAQAMFLHSLSSSPWFEPPADTMRYAREAREGLIRGGDLWNAGFTYFSSMYGALGYAAHLGEAEAEADAGLALTTRTGDGLTSGTVVIYRQTVRALQGRTAVPGGMDDDGFDAEAHLATLGGNATAAANLHACAGLLAALFDDTAALERHSAALMPLLPFVEATQVTAHARLLRGLALARRLRNAARPGGAGAEAEAAPAAVPVPGPAAGPVPDHRSARERTDLLAELETCVTWMARRAEECPANFAANHAFLRAEQSWARGESEEAADWFDRACEGHRSGQTPGLQSLAVEEYARLRLARGQDFAGGTLLRIARDGYAQWGAEGKVAVLETEFPFLQDDAAPTVRGPVDTRRPSTVVSGNSIDLVAILRAFQVLSTETSVARLQDRVSEVLALLSGASRVRLVLRDPDSGGWSVPVGAGDGVGAGAGVGAGVGVGAGESGLVGLGRAVAEGLVPASVFRYVERTGEMLVVEDALSDVRFAADPYFAGVGRCSVLVVPVVVRGGMRAVLVLENRLARGAFTVRRTDAVVLIAGELGVCLDNMLAERFRSLVQRSAELTLVCERSVAVRYASAACGELLGRSEQSVVGVRPGELFVAEDRELVTGLLEQVVAGEPASLVARLAHMDGTARWVEGTLTDLTGDPAVGGVMVRLRDVSERHRLEMELRHAQKLESVGQLAAGIAHEINTPMQFITTNLHFLSEAFAELSAAGGAGAGVDGRAGVDRGGVNEELLAEIPAALAETLQGAERVVTIVRAMKAFGHPGGESKGWADLNEAVRNTLVVAANEIRPAAEVVSEFGELPPVWCNLGDLNQVVLNLVINAAQAMAEKVAAGGPRGTLTVRTRAEESAVVIEVQDTGTGIPADIADRVFDQFFTTKDVGVGTGQGLALAHTLIHDHHGGTLTFTSTPGTGTTFTVRIPREQE